MQEPIKSESGLIHVLNRCNIWLKKGVKSAVSTIPESWSTTIKTQKTNLVVWLASSLMGIAGRLLHSEKKLGNVESYAQTATANIPSNSKGITRTKKFRGTLENSPQGISLSYENPNDFLYDVTNGAIHPRDVNLEQWLIAHGYAMIDSKLPHLHTSVMIGGQLFGMHHCIESIHYPTLISPLQEYDH
jgi:hypothetical protein